MNLIWRVTHLIWRAHDLSSLPVHAQRTPTRRSHAPFERSHITMTTTTTSQQHDYADLFMHPAAASCVIEEVVDAQEGQQQQHAAAGAANGITSTSASSISTSTSDPQHPGAAGDAEAGAQRPSDRQQQAGAGPLHQHGQQDEQPKEQEPGTSGAPLDPQTAAQLAQLLAECEELKQQGNAAFAREEWDEALQLYWQVCCCVLCVCVCVTWGT
jgi:hypothetical protein